MIIALEELSFVHLFSFFLPPLLFSFFETTSLCISWSDLNSLSSTSCPSVCGLQELRLQVWIVMSGFTPLEEENPTVVGMCTTYLLVSASYKVLGEVIGKKPPAELWTTKCIPSLFSAWVLLLGTWLLFIFRNMLVSCDPCFCRWCVHECNSFSSVKIHGWKFEINTS